MLNDPAMTKIDRQSRLATALRENLKRRKRQNRERVREVQPEHDETQALHISASNALNPALQEVQNIEHHDIAQKNIKLKETD